MRADRENVPWLVKAVVPTNIEALRWEVGDGENEIQTRINNDNRSELP